MDGPLGLGPVLRRVGQPEQPPGGVHRPDRVLGGRHPAGHTVPDAQFHRPPAHLVGRLDHLVGRRPHRQQTELVPAQPRRQRPGQHGPAQRQHGPEPLEQPVPHGMPQRVVDPLQPVHIAHHQADHGPVPPVPLHGLVQAGVHGAPVGQPGQRVREGQPPGLLQPLRLRDPGGHHGGQHRREVGVRPPEDGHPGRPGHVQLAPGPPVQHDRRDHTAPAPAPPQRRDPLVAVPGPPRRGPLCGLHPRVGLTAPRPPLMEELGDLGELVHRIGLVLRELLLPLGQLPHVHQHPQPPQLALPHRQRGETAAQRPAGPAGRGPPGLPRTVRGGHALGQRHHGRQPALLTHLPRLRMFSPNGDIRMTNRIHVITLRATAAGASR